MYWIYAFQVSLPRKNAKNLPVSIVSMKSVEWNILIEYLGSKKYKIGINDMRTFSENCTAEIQNFLSVT